MKLLKYSYFLLSLIAFFCFIGRLDRLFFKQNHSFSLRCIYSTLPFEKTWEITDITDQKEKERIDSILSQKFYYFTKGKQTFVFLSEDKKYVLKLYRVHSTLRPLPWLSHPLIYLSSEKKNKKLEANLAHLYETFNSFKYAYQDLKKESGLILIHLNKTKTLKKTVCLVDSYKIEYEIPLDDISFVLQKKGVLLFSHLDYLIKNDHFNEAKQLIKDVVDLFITCTTKGYEDVDAVLTKNYGVLDKSVFILDFGRLHPINEMDSLKQIVLIKTEGLKQKISSHKLLLDYYLELMNNL